jgi:hypothetical protein
MDEALLPENECKIPDERRCTHVLADGRRCRLRRWGEHELCFQHHPDAAEERKNAGRPPSALRVITATEVHEVLAQALEEVRAGSLPVGRAYAIGYLAQLLLGNLEAVGEEYKEARNEWDRYSEKVWRVRLLDQGYAVPRRTPPADEPPAEAAPAEKPPESV